MSMLDQLTEMGFDKQLAAKALKATEEASVDLAAEWLIDHADDVEKMDEDEGEVQESSVELVDGSEEKHDGCVQSLKCNDCDKLLKDADAAMLHAKRTGHENFGESTDAIVPLTKEQRKQQTEIIRAKINERSVQKQDEERKLMVELEKKRRMDGQRVQQAQEQNNLNEMKKLADDKKREKIEQNLARKRVLAKIQIDREARKSDTADLPTASDPVPECPPVRSSTCTDCHLHIRLPSGRTVIPPVFLASEQLAAVRLWLQLNRTDELGDSFTLMTPFPRRIFQACDYNAPLGELGLTPTAVLVVAKVVI